VNDQNVNNLRLKTQITISDDLIEHIKQHIVDHFYYERTYRKIMQYLLQVGNLKFK
jgi:hypothetical protein